MYHKLPDLSSVFAVSAAIAPLVTKVMAYVIIQAAPSRLISQLHFVRNHLGELSGQREMWVAHFTVRAARVRLFFH